MTDPRVVVDAESGLAPWRQVRDQLAALVDGRALSEGTRLPSIRRLARDLGVAPGTVARAYRELEAAGRVRTARGGGTVVARAGPEESVDERLREAARHYLTAARALGVAPDDAVTTLRSEAAGAATG